MYLFKLIRSGQYKPAGVVDIPFLGAKVGELQSWTLTRRGDEGPDADLYNLHAVFSFVVDALWDDPDYTKRVVVSVSPHKHYRLDQGQGFATVRAGRSLVIEGVTIHGV